MITIELLKSWSPCADGFKRFCELFPSGTDLKTAGEKLAEDGHADWGLWLYEKSRAAKLFDDVTIRGYRNTGDQNTGDQNTGDRNTGDRNTGNWNTGSWNTGNWNTGNWNTGDQNTGNWNTGDQNTGDRNTGDRNTGYRNTGDQNTGNWNTGNWNTGNWNTGFFNTVTPDDILLFNKPCSRAKFDNAYKPNFLYFDLTYWVNESQMSDTEKAADPNYYMRGGQLRKKDYKVAFKESWDAANQADREYIREMPNFDAQVFFEISGIDLR